MNQVVEYIQEDVRIIYKNRNIPILIVIGTEIKTSDITK